MKKAAQVFPSWIPTTVAKIGGGKKKKHEESEKTGEDVSLLQSSSRDPADSTHGLSFLKAPRVVYKGHQLPVRSIAVLVAPNPEDSLILSGGDDKLILVWSLKTGNMVAELKGHTQRVISLSIFQSTNADSYVVSGSWDEKLRIWPINDCVSSAKASDSKFSQTFEARSTSISSLSVVMKGHSNRIFAVAVVNRSGEAPFVASASADNTIRVWSLPDGRPLYVLEDDEDTTWNLCLSSWFIADNGECAFHGTALITGCKNTTVRVWRHRSGAELENINSKASVLGDALKSVVDAFSKHSAPLVRTTPDLVITGHTSSVHALAPFDSLEQPYVVTACKDLDLRIFSLLTGSLVKILRGHSTSISGIAAHTVSSSRGGAIIVSSSREGANMRVWKYSTGECLRFFKGHTQDINAVEVFPSPDAHRDDLVIVSASKDTTVRSWLFAQEKALKIFDHGSRQKIKAMDVLHKEGQSIVVTGAEDGSLRAWRTKRDEGDEEHSAMQWKVEKAHKHRVLAMCIYTPLPDDDCHFEIHVNKHWPAHLHSPLIFSSSRDGDIRVSNFKDGGDVIPPIRAHQSPITSLAVCSGARSSPFNKALDPFLVSGSEDNTAVIWSLIDFSKLRVFEGHIFDVTCVSIYLPKPAGWEETHKAFGGGGVSGRVTPREGAPVTSPLPADTPLDPIIVTGSMDNEVRLWHYSSAECVQILDAAESHITCVSCINIEESANTKYVGPIVVAGDGFGTIWVWALTAPYKQIYTLKGHTDEVRTVYAYHAEGIPPVLVSGSLDCTVKVWNLETMKLNKTMEGHTSDVTVVRVFNLGGSDLALVSTSLDTTARVVFDFMEAAPQLDVVLQLFQFDANGTNIHVMVDANSDFPRIAALSKKEGPEQFFGTYFALFGAALRQGRCEFLEEFLPQSNLGLVKSNKGKTNDKGEMEADFDGLLRQALDRGDTRAVRIIVDCWCKFYSDGSSDLIHNEDARISMQDLIQLSEQAPAEFERLICSIKLVPVPGNFPPPDVYFLYERDTDHTIRMRQMPSKEVIKAAIAVPQAAESSLSGKTFLYLPIANAAHMELLYAYTATCEELDSVEIFNSDVGKLALAYAWRRMGLKVHWFRMAMYCIFVAISTVSLLTYSKNMNDPHTAPVAYALIIAQLVLDAYFVFEERKQFFVNPLLYVLDIWNFMDIIVVISNVAANVLRLIYSKDIVAGKVFLCLTSIFSYFNILYFLRAFEETGPLVSMIMKIANDMKVLIVIVMIVLVGFSQAFWVLSSVDRDLPFGTIENSLLNSYSFMLGGFDPSAFEGTPLNRFAIALSCFYMLIVSILLLNLLIALMGDSYGSVREKGLAQWKLEQAQIVTEMQGSMSAEDRQCTDVVYFRTNRLEQVEETQDRTAVLEATVQDLKYSQKKMMKLLLEQQERMQEQVEVNSLLREFLTAKTHE